MIVGSGNDACFGRRLFFVAWDAAVVYDVYTKVALMHIIQKGQNAMKKSVYKKVVLDNIRTKVNCQELRQPHYDAYVMQRYVDAAIHKLADLLANYPKIDVTKMKFFKGDLEDVFDTDYICMGTPILRFIDEDEKLLVGVRAADVMSVDEPENGVELSELEAFCCELFDDDGDKWVKDIQTGTTETYEEFFERNYDLDMRLCAGREPMRRFCSAWLNGSHRQFEQLKDDAELNMPLMELYDNIMIFDRPSYPVKMDFLYVDGQCALYDQSLKLGAFFTVSDTGIAVNTLVKREDGFKLIKKYDVDGVGAAEDVLKVMQCICVKYHADNVFPAAKDIYCVIEDCAIFVKRETDGELDYHLRVLWPIENDLSSFGINVDDYNEDDLLSVYAIYDQDEEGYEDDEDDEDDEMIDILDDEDDEEIDDPDFVKEFYELRDKFRAAREAGKGNNGQ